MILLWGTRARAFAFDIWEESLYFIEIGVRLCKSGPPCALSSGSACACAIDVDLSYSMSFSGFLSLSLSLSLSLTLSLSLNDIQKRTRGYKYITHNKGRTTVPSNQDILRQLM